MPILVPRLANTYDITMTTVTRRAKPSWAGNSGIPEDPPDFEDDVNDVPVVCGVVEVVEVVDEVANEASDRTVTVYWPISFGP